MATPTLLFLNLGTGEIIMIMFVVLLLFGSNKIPELAKGLGKGMREFKDATRGIQEEIQKSAREVQNETKKITTDVTNQLPKDQPTDTDL